MMRSNTLYYLTGIIFLLSLSSCSEESTTAPSPPEERELREQVLIESQVFTVSYNEVFEQPNWVEYDVRDIEKRADRDGLEFYTVDSVHTSNTFDYIDNIWDRGHMAPAAAFWDSYDNLYATFSYLNCSLQRDSLNRNQWQELEIQVRDWASEFGTMKVRIDLDFQPDHIILSTGAHVPDGYWKRVTFPDLTTKCYYFPNDYVQEVWTSYEIECL
jgi:DNA/RNA endonuclease G (NUC1)